MPKNNMEYISTKDGVNPTSFLEAMETGLAADGGLYIPKQWPELLQLWDTIQGRSLQEIGSTIAKKFIPEIAADKLDDLVCSALPFDAPLIPLSDELNILELFHGRTLAFNGFGARYVAGRVNDHCHRA